uniref:Immunoglobulin V-set domain-containing protein n=1 Tax=Podarcis muralis TaxID=64176 RepID=A0A670INN5_PODMU
MATYSEAGGTTILSKFKRNVHMSQSGLMVSAITFHATLKDEGCYKCIFNVFPIGPITGRTCLKVYGKSCRILKEASDLTGRPTMPCYFFSARTFVLERATSFPTSNLPMLSDQQRGLSLFYN